MVPVGFPIERSCISWLADVLKINLLELTPMSKVWSGWKRNLVLFVHHVPQVVLSEAEATYLSICREFDGNLIYWNSRKNDTSILLFIYFSTKLANIYWASTII